MKVYLMKRTNPGEIGKSIKRIDGMYRDVIAIFKEYCSQDAINALSDDFRSYLEHVNDFEGIGFYVINGSIVVTVDSFGGDIYSVDTLANFLHDTYKYYQEEYGSNWEDN